MDTRIAAATERGTGLAPVAEPRHPAAASLGAAMRRVVGLSAVAGCVEVTGYLDCSSIYPGIMTGNTVQLGLTAATASWSRFELIGTAVASFFVGGLVAAFVRRQLRRPAWELFAMAAILCLASVVRGHAGWKLPLELPLLAMAMAMQGQALTTFGGVSVQTIVVTNSMVKFTDAVVGRWLKRRGAERPSLGELVLPGVAWLAYSVAAGAGALLASTLRLPLGVPVALLVVIGLDLTRDETPRA